MHFDVLDVADASQIDARHHGLSPEPLPFSCAEIVSALEAVDECLVSSCEVLVVRGMLQGHAPSVVHLQHGVLHRGGGQVSHGGVRQNAGGLLNRHGPLVHMPVGPIVQAEIQTRFRLNVVQLERGGFGLKGPRGFNARNRHKVRGRPP